MVGHSFKIMHHCFGIECLNRCSSTWKKCDCQKKVPEWMQYSVFWKKCRGVAPLLYFIKKSNTFLENRGCSAPWERNPLSTHFRQQLWHSLTNVLVQVCAKLPSQGSEPLDWTTLAYKETQYYEVEPLGVCSIFWEKQVMIVCVQYALPYVKSFLKVTCHTEKWEEGWALLQDVLHLSTSCIFLQECCFLLKGIPCLHGN